ncbi:MAG: crossover junction endodeoxyribonuclease RuvC [Candidatus Omnitrophica bacterium]|nr:crossover junction endodeoxyribonuclease RuvC [Candidatus Omnitrophota bacterium]
MTYGVIDVDKKKIALIEAGIISTSSKDQTPKRLERINKGINKLIADTKPDCLVLEKIYAHYRHPATSYILGQARGVICLACAQAKIPLVEYAATRVKKAIVGNGLASKAQVQRMVANTLGIVTLPKYKDVTDALAMALAHSAI